MTEINFLLNEKRKRNELFLVKAKFALFAIVFIAVIITNFDRYSSPKASTNDFLMLAMWLLYPIYLFLFHRAKMKRFTLQCSKCRHVINLENDYREGADLEQISSEKCIPCGKSLDLSSIDHKG